ncbi:hypothetical protein GCM10027062_04190 [Nocardioides hungaricus]|jgi:hypothetical protein
MAEPTEVLRELWDADRATDAAVELDDATPAKVCKRMRDVTFDGMAEPGTDLRQAWRDRLAREGKLGTGETIRDLVLGRERG